MIAEVIFTGTELLLGQILNTNAQRLQQTLASLGIDLYYQVTVGDNRERCAQAIRQAADRVDVVFIGGGLGPTEDDVSREALSEALQVPLVQDEAALKVVQRFYLARGTAVPEVNLKQALVPVGGKVLDNPIGTAPGIVLEHHGKVFFQLPGPPSEFNLMLDEQVVPYLRSRFPEELGIIHSRVLKVCGVGESVLAETLGDLLKNPNPTVSTCVKEGYIDLSITAKAGDGQVARRDIAAMEEAVRQLIGRHIFGAGQDTLPGVVGRELAKRGESLAVVEELSGGLLACKLSVDPLSAQVFAGGMVLGQAPGRKGFSGGVSRPQGASAKEAAEELARAVRHLTGSSIGMAVLEPDPQGEQAGNKNTVIIGIDLGNEVRVKEIPLWGNKSEAARRSAETAMVELWRVLQETAQAG